MIALYRPFIVRDTAQPLEATRATTQSITWKRVSEAAGKTQLILDKMASMNMLRFMNRSTYVNHMTLVSIADILLFSVFLR